MEYESVNMYEKLTPCPYLYCYDKIKVFTADGKSYDSCERCRYKNGVKGTKYSSSRRVYKEGAKKETFVTKILRFLKGGIIEN